MYIHQNNIMKQRQLDRINSYSLLVIVYHKKIDLGTCLKLRYRSKALVQ